MESKSFPSVLVISPNSFNPYFGGGVTLTNLYKGWPKDKIAILHSDTIPSDHSVCENEYRLASAELEWKWPVSMLKRWQNSRKQGRDEQSTSSGEIEQVVVGPSRIEKIQRFLIGDGLFHKAKISSRLEQWVLNFKPQLVYSLLGSIPFIRLTKGVAALAGAPITIHMMDDWMETSYRRGVIAPYFRRQILSEGQDIVSLASLRMAISPSMAEAYGKRWGHPFVDFMNTIDVASWERDSRKKWDKAAPFRVVYSGAIIANSALEGIRDVCRAVAELHASGMEIEMALCCPDSFKNRYASELENHPSVKFYPPPEHGTVASLFAGADLLVLPVNFDDESIRYIRYSMPTKVPAYMCSGTPVLVYGPGEVASVQYAEREGWGYVVSEQGVDKLVDAIKVLAADDELRKRLALRAKEVALKNHDAGHVRAAFRRELAAAAGM